MSAGRLVFLREMREMLRDKRVIYSSLFGPIFLILVFVLLFGFLQTTIRRPKAHVVHVVTSSPEPAFVSALRKADQLQLKSVSSMESGERLVRSGDARVVLFFPPGFDDSLRSSEPAKVHAIYDPDLPASQITLSIVEGIVRETSRGLVKAILKARGVSEELADPLRLEKRALKRKEESIGGFLAGLLPYLVVIWAFYGGFSTAADIVAGEKERSTLETLLISPAGRPQIALGKFWALTVLCFASSVVSLFAVAIAGVLPIQMIRELMPEGVRFSLGSIVAIAAVLLPLSALFAGLLLAISAYARNTRECQGYLTMVSFIVLMPAIFSQFIGYTSFAKAWWVSFVPVLNAATVLKDAMLGNFPALPMATTTGVNVVLACMATMVAIRLFGKETVLWRV